MIEALSDNGAVRSRDGIRIAFEAEGQGPPIILVAAALSDRGDMKRMSATLSQHFRVINYDRRGRGDSGDGDSYTTDREIEDIAALIHSADEPAFLFGSSSGAILALDAAGALGDRVRGVAMYEPPLILNGGRPALPASFRADVKELLDAGRRSAAVKSFMREALGVPSFGIWIMSLLPSWGKMTRMAHTLLYDLSIMEGLQAGEPLPESRWSGGAPPTLILTGGKSEQFFDEGAGSLAALLPGNAQHRILEGQHHGSPVMSPKAIGAEVAAFFSGEEYCGSGYEPIATRVK